MKIIKNSAEEDLNTENLSLISNNDHVRTISRLSAVGLECLQSGAKFFVPTVNAAPANEPPKKPPPMKYNDLPLYDCPHHKYKEYICDQDKCPDYKVKLIHEAFAPTVSAYRKDIGDSLYNLRKEATAAYCEISDGFIDAENRFLAYMRDPENQLTSKLFIGVAGLAGFRLGKTIPRRLAGSGLALFVAGSICCPKETDELARTIMNTIGKCGVSLYNFYFGTDWELRERVPCPSNLPEIPKPPTKPFPGCTPPKK